MGSDQEVGKSLAGLVFQSGSRDKALAVTSQALTTHSLGRPRLRLRMANRSKKSSMSAQQNAAIVGLARVLEEASLIVGIPAADILVDRLELRSRPEQPGPLPPAFFIQLSGGLSYWADTQGNIARINDRSVDGELRVRFIQEGGLAGLRSVYEADESSLTAGEVSDIRSMLDESEFFDLPDRVRNGEPIPDLFQYMVWVAVGRRNRSVTTYDGTGPHASPALMKLIEWLKQRSPAPGPVAEPQAV